MAQTVKLKRSNTAGTIPTTSNLALGEVAINTKDGKFFLRKHVDGSTGDAIHAYAPQGLNAFGTQELVVKVVTKTTAHPNHGNGSSSGYTVQGLEGPFLALIPGNTYKFDVSDSTNSGHPFRFYLDAAKATAYTTGVTTSGSAGNSGAYVQIAVTTSTPQVLYYQCSSHSLMGSAAYVASDAIAANAVGTSQIAQNSITSSEIPNNSIGATQISAAVLAAKQDNLGNNSITAAMISQNTVGISELNVSDGSSGQVLTTNGSGTLSFANQSAGTVTETFKTISVSGQDDVVADGATDTLTLAAGSGMTITTNASNDTVTFVSSAAGIADDAVTTSKIADLNVTSAKLANNSVTAAKIATDAVGASEIAANSVGISELNVSDGSNGQVLTTNGSGTLSFATASGSVSEAFKTLSVSGQDDVVADSATDTLNFAAGSNMTITTNASNDTITFASSGSGGSSSSFAKNTFSGDGSETDFTLTTSMSNENGLIVFIDGVYQADNVYSVSGTTLTFATAPVNGRVIEVFQLEGGIVGTAPVLATMTGDGSDTTLALGTTPSSENQCFVTIDGVMQHKSTYSVSGSTLTFSTAPPNGTAVEAITLTNTSVATFQDSDGDTKIQMEESSDEDKIRFDTGGTERMIIDDAGKVGIGTSTLHKNLNIHTSDSNSANIVFTNSATGTSSNDGFYVGIDSNESPEFWNYENTDLIIGLNNAERFRIKADGKVGIGTSTPSQILNVEATSTPVIEISTLADNNPASASAIDLIEKQPSYASATATFGQTGVYGYRIQLHGDDNTLRIKSGSQTTTTDRITLTRDEGNVGIGTTSPTDPLVVSDSGASSITARFINTNADANPANIRLQKLSGSPADDDYIGMINVSGENDASEETIFQSIDFISTDVSDGSEDGVIAFRTRGAGTLAERLRISEQGFIKLPSKVAFSGTGDAGLGHHTNNYMYIYGGSAGLILQDNSGGSNRILIRDSDTMEFQTGGSERMRIDSSGNLLAGVTSAYNSGHTIYKNGGVALNVSRADGGASNSLILGYGSSTTLRIAIRGDGDIENTNNSYGSLSDKRLKSNIVDANSQLEDIKKVKVRRYTLDSTGETHIGVIAQELEEAGMSGLVTESEDTEYKGVKYSILFMKAIKAIQEQQVIIEDLKARIETLEG